MSWFVGYYYAVILIAVLFLNSFLQKIDNKRYISFLIVIFAFIQFGWTGGLADGLIPDLRTLLNGIFLYALGGYLKKYDPLGKLRIYVFFLAIIITYFFVNLSAYNNTENKIENYIRNKTEDDFIQSVSGFSNYSIIVIIIGVCLFEIFKRIRIPRADFLIISDRLHLWFIYCMIMDFFIVSVTHKTGLQYCIIIHIGLFLKFLFGHVLYLYVE